MWVDNTLTFDSLIILGLDKASGTYAFGINGLKVMFGGFTADVVRSDIKIVKQLKVDGAKESMSMASGGNDSDDQLDSQARKAENSKD